MSTTNMDPFDEFEFKPLTEGLGFHKKAVSLKEGLKSSGVIQDELSAIPLTIPKSLIDETPTKGGKNSKRHSFDDVLSALEKTPLQRSATADLQFTEPLPREKQNKKAAMDVEVPTQSPFPKPEAFKGPNNKKTPAVSEAPKTGARRGAADSPKRQLQTATISVPSAFLDLVIITALALVFLVALLMVTKVDLNSVLRNLNEDLMTQISLGVLFVAVMQMYVVISRVFFGRTLGEWTFDLQIGEDHEQQNSGYPFRVAFRSLLTTCTGLIILPVLSALIGHDIAGELSGAKLYRQRV